MLEITILKVKHEREEDAKKLLLYIQQCDVYAPESVLLTLEKAEEREKGFQKLISRNLNRNQLNALLEEYAHRAYEPTQFPKFSTKEWEYLYREQKSLWYVERFAPSEAEELKKKYTDAHLLVQEAGIWLLESKAIGTYLQKYRAYLSLLDSIRPERDKHIAQNLAEAEESIRQKYPLLAQKENISLCLSLGAIHQVEELYPVNQVIPLVDQPTTAAEKLTALRLQKVKPDDIPSEHILAVVATILLKFPEAEVEGLSFDELSEKVKKAISEQKR